MTVRVVLLLIAVFCSGGAIAQSSGSENQAAVSGVQPGQTYRLGVYGPWEHRCVKAPVGQQDNCSLYQLLRQANSSNPIAEINVFALAPGEPAVAGANVTTPLGTLLQQGVRFSVDGDAPKAYPYVYCQQSGCVAQMGFSAPELFALERGSEATIAIFSRTRPNDAVLIRLDLSNFVQAYDALIGEP